MLSWDPGFRSRKGNDSIHTFTSSIVGPRSTHAAPVSSEGWVSTSPSYGVLQYKSMGYRIPFDADGYFLLRRSHFTHDHGFIILYWD